MHDSFWRKQSSAEPLFPDIEWNRPEQKSRAGKLAIIGGNKLGFVAVATAYQEAVDLGAGQVHAVLPDALKPAIPTTILDTVYVPSNSSGGMNRDAEPLVLASLMWTDHALLIGDAGRNSETAMIYESLLRTDRPLTITRDAIDLLKNASMAMISRPSTTLVVSFAQLQKLFQAVYYPKMLSFSMQLSLLVDTLHKFTTTYPCLIVTYHQNQLVIAHAGQVITQEFDQPILIWRGTAATRTACYQLWTPSKSFEATAASAINL
ncbi:MAG: hypothetical protein WBB39_03035 [Candidatus Saccharimonadales bacterium]